MKRYNGKEVCQGCGLPGIIKPRYDKEKLCETCQKEIAKGRQTLSEESISYITVFQHWHAFPSGSGLNELIHSLLNSIANEHAPSTGYNTIKQQTGSNGERYNIPEKFYIPLIEFFKKLDHNYKDYLNDKERLIENSIKSVKDEKNKIFMEGVNKGRELLQQLNSGDISMKDFERTLSKY